MTDNTTSQIGIRVTDEERAVIEDEASREHLSLSSLVRSIVLKEIKRRREAREHGLLSHAA